MQFVPRPNTYVPNKVSATTDNRDNVYLNVTINPSMTTGVSLAQYDETFSIPIIENPSEYFCSIIRLQLPLDGVPIFSAGSIIDVSQTNPNVTLCKIGIVWLGVPYSVNVVYPAYSSIAPPVPAGSAPYFNSTQLSSPYYNVFTVNKWLQAINFALSLAITNSGSGLDFPYFQFDPATQLISLMNVSVAMRSQVLFINSYLLNYLNSFNYYFNSYNDPNGNDYQFIFYSLQSQGLGPFYTYVQDYTSMDLWYDIRRILVTSAGLPIVNEITPTISSNGTTSYLPIVTDYALGLENLGQTSQLIVYNPSAQYRLIDMVGQSPLTKLSFSVYYVDRFGNNIAFPLTPLQQITMKIGFFKRELYHQNLVKL